MPIAISGKPIPALIPAIGISAPAISRTTAKPRSTRLRLLTSVVFMARVWLASSHLPSAIASSKSAANYLIAWSAAPWSMKSQPLDLAQVGESLQRVGGEAAKPLVAAIGPGRAVQCGERLADPLGVLVPALEPALDVAGVPEPEHPPHQLHVARRHHGGP